MLRQENSKIGSDLETARRLHSAGHLHEAEQLYSSVLASTPDHPDALHYLGLLAHRLGDQKQARDLIGRSIALSPEEPTYYYNAGQMLMALGNADEAIDLCRKAIELRPTYAAAHGTLASAWRRKNAVPETVEAARRALALGHDTLETHANLVWGLLESGNIEKAIEGLEKCLALNSGSVHAWFDLGLALVQKGLYEQALAAFDRVLRLEPGHCDALHNIGTSLCQLGRNAEAIDFYHKSLNISVSAETYANIGTSLADLGRADEAMSYYLQAQALNPAWPRLSVNIGMLRLSKGDYIAGWKDFEARDDCVAAVAKFSQPMWDGSDLRGRRILLEAEQGFGDTIQFIRYAPMVAARGGQVIVRVQRDLHRLLAEISGVQLVLSDTDPLPPFELHCPLLSLPRAFGTTLQTIPSSVPYVSAPPELARRWRARLSHEPPGVKVGLAWAGSPTYRNDRDRSMHLSMLATLAGLPGVRFYSLQRGYAATQTQTPPPGLNLVDWTSDLHDFADNAAFMHNLDVIVSTDTSIAHLAGALAKPTYVLLSYAPAYHWLLDRTDSPWYPTAQLFRQKQLGDWREPLEQLAGRLEVLASEHVPAPNPP